MLGGDDWLEKLIFVIALVMLVFLPFQWRRNRRDPFLALALGFVFLSVLVLNAEFLLSALPHWMHLTLSGLFLSATFVLLVIHARTTAPAQKPKWLSKGPAALALSIIPTTLIVVGMALSDIIVGGYSVLQTIRFWGPPLTGALGLIIIVIVLLDKLGRTSGRPILPSVTLAVGLLLTGAPFPPQAPLVGPTAAMLFRIGAVLALVGLVWVGLDWRRRRAAERNSHAAR